MTPPAAAAAATRQPRGWLATLAVLLVMVGIVGGGFFAADALADIPIGPVEVGRGVTVTPGEGWQFGGRSEDGNTILLSRGTGSAAVTIVPDKTPGQALVDLKAGWLADGTVSASEIAPVSGVRNDREVLHFGYSGTFDEIAANVEGEVYGMAGSGFALLFDGWAGTGQYLSVRDDIIAMISATVIP